MKKILFVFLAAVLVFGFCATASADFELPRTSKPSGTRPLSAYRQRTI